MFPLCFYAQTMPERQFRLEAKHLFIRSNIKMIPNGDINFLGTLHTAFPALLKTWLTGYSTSAEKCLLKSDKCSKRVVLLKYGKPIANRPVFHSSLLTFRWLISQKIPNIQLESKHLVVCINIQNDPQQWDKWPWKNARHVSGLI